MVIVDILFGCSLHGNEIMSRYNYTISVLAEGWYQMRAAAYGIYIIRLETSAFSSFYLFGRGTYNNGNTKVHTDKNACTINIYIMDQENK